MALSPAIIFALLTATFFPTISMAKDFIVGDEMGWTVGFDYQTWTENKVFRVGDKLIFKYPSGEHNVFQVNGTDFRNCNVPAATQGLTTGEDGLCWKLQAENGTYVGLEITAKTGKSFS